MIKHFTTFLIFLTISTFAEDSFKLPIRAKITLSDNSFLYGKPVRSGIHIKNETLDRAIDFSGIKSIHYYKTDKLIRLTMRNGDKITGTQNQSIEFTTILGKQEILLSR